MSQEYLRRCFAHPDFACGVIVLFPVISPLRICNCCIQLIATYLSSRHRHQLQGGRYTVQISSIWFCIFTSCGCPIAHLEWGTYFLFDVIDHRRQTFPQIDYVITQIHLYYAVRSRISFFTGFMYLLLSKRDHLFQTRCTDIIL